MGLDVSIIQNTKDGSPVATDQHPLQPIRDGIEVVYAKARAEGNQKMHVLALTMLAHLDKLRQSAGLPPIARGEHL